MNTNNWLKEFPGAVTVCDPEGIVLEMNDRAAETFASDGGYALVGTNLLGCHPEVARKKLLLLLESHQTNVYTIQKNGKKKMIYQSPLFHEGKFSGFVELALEVPLETPHFNRDKVG